MRIVRIQDGARKKFKHHIDLRRPEDIRSYSVPESFSGCEEQVFSSSDLKRTLRFRAEALEIDSDNRRIRMWYAPYPKNFFEIKIRLQKEYLSNLEEIAQDMMFTFFDIPKYACRGGRISDLSGKVLQRRVNGSEDFVPRLSRLTEEVEELIGTENDKLPRNTKSFDYWVSDYKILEQGFAITVGNEDSKEFVRYHKLDGSIVTAYIRPYFYMEYSM